MYSISFHVNVKMGKGGGGAQLSFAKTRLTLSQLDMLQLLPCSAEQDGNMFMKHSVDISTEVL